MYLVYNKYIKNVKMKKLNFRNVIKINLLIILFFNSYKSIYFTLLIN